MSNQEIPQKDLIQQVSPQESFEIHLLRTILRQQKEIIDLLEEIKPAILSGMEKIPSQIFPGREIPIKQKPLIRTTSGLVSTLESRSYNASIMKKELPEEKDIK